MSDSNFIQGCHKHLVGYLGRDLICVIAARSRDLHRSLKSAVWLPVVTSGRCTTSAPVSLRIWLALPSMHWQLWPLLV